MYAEKAAWTTPRGVPRSGVAVGVTGVGVRLLVEDGSGVEVKLGVNVGVGASVGNGVGRLVGVHSGGRATSAAGGWEGGRVGGTLAAIGPQPTRRPAETAQARAWPMILGPSPRIRGFAVIVRICN